jgi:chromosome segregation ATPase
MSDYIVIAECVDERTGQRYLRGQKFPSPTVAQEERLTKAGCIRKPTDEEAKAARAEEAVRQRQLEADRIERESKAAEAKTADDERERQRLEAQGEIDRLNKRLSDEAREREALIAEHKREIAEISAKLDESLAKRADAETAAAELQRKLEHAATELSETKSALAAEVEARKKADEALAAAPKTKKS